jgi:hypothetical protein
MVNNRTAKNVKGGSIYGKTSIDKDGSVILAVSPKNKLSNSVDIFEKRNSDIIQNYYSITHQKLLDFYKITENKKNVIITKQHLTFYSNMVPDDIFKSIVYVDENDEVLFPKDLSKVMSSSKKKVYETEICFKIDDFNPSAGYFRYRSYGIIIIFKRKIREIKIDRGFFYHGIYVDSTMSYNSWQHNKKQTTVNVDQTYDTFWFNLCPVFQRQVAVIVMESHLMNPHNFIDTSEKFINKTITAFAQKIFNRTFNNVKFPEEQYYPPVTQQNYNGFSPTYLMMETGKELEFPRRAGGGKGEPGVPPTEEHERHEKKEE